MLGVLRNRTYRHLFTAQVVALLGTGLATVALGLLAHDLAGAEAATVLGTALTIKMVAYVGLGPVLTALAARLPRRPLLICTNLIRGGVAVCLPLVSEVWQVYVLILVLQASSATFTPVFQAVIPEVLPRDRDYTRALSLSRLAYDLESLLSPMMAAALLTVLTYPGLFLGTALGFAVAALLIGTVVLPPREVGAQQQGRWAAITVGVRMFARWPALRSLAVLNLSVAVATALVLVTTVTYVREDLGGSEADVAVALGAFGAGSMVVALALPRVLDNREQRPLFLAAPLLHTGTFALLATVVSMVDGWWWPLLGAWLLLGAGCSLVLTPTARLLRDHAGSGELPALLAAQFSLSHAGFLVTYPLAGWAGTHLAPQTALVGCAVLTGGCAVAARVLWRIRQAEPADFAAA
ncbi:MFS transporter [Lipingzhangella sp. LS1_29]|uniref:MFS transporter n=1 Tax=Lipingzhangella rawalii TaxID=2055835 RepID=A0ABU2HBF2_9ACTN|nr:MFS transporter [Lipingzhangella rawalii]MDS1272648.1 MFS transporter [Lipingzhangella rawalii]